MTPISEPKRTLLFAVAATLVAATASTAQNLVPNGDFRTSVSGWTLVIGQQLLWTADYDEAECPGSGAAVAEGSPVSNPVGKRAFFFRCVSFGQIERLSLQLRFATNGKIIYGIDAYSSSNCTGSAIGGFSGQLWPDVLGWKAGSASVPVPAAARSGSVYFASWAPDEVVLGVDSVVVSVDEPIFLDGFEGDLPGSTAPCRWSPGP